MSKFRKKNKRLTLQLTSLLDMFTIILVFLMVSFQANDKDFVLNSGLQLPASSATSDIQTAVNLAITQRSVVVDGKKVFELEPGGRVKDSDFKAGKIDVISEAVKQAWEDHKKEEMDEDVVLVQADKHLPYRTIHLVMRSAAQSGFRRFRLVIEKE